MNIINTFCNHQKHNSLHKIFHKLCSKQGNIRLGFYFVLNCHYVFSENRQLNFLTVNVDPDIFQGMVLLAVV